MRKSMKKRGTLKPLLAATHCEHVSINTWRSVAKIDGLERNTQNLEIPTPRFARMFSTWNPPSHAEGAYPQNCMVELPSYHVSVFEKEF